MNLEHGRWPEALVAALASLSVGWPLTTLLQEQTWVADGVAMVGLVAVLGAVLRSLGALPSLVALTQLVAGLWALSWLFLAPTLWFGLPTPSSGAMAVDLFAEAGTVLREFAAPAPTTSGVSFLVVSVLLLTAVAVDSIGVTNASPGVAGIPLAAAFLVSVSNNGEPMQPWFFVATASLWMVLVAQQSNRLLSAWPTADRHDFGGPTRFGRGYRTLARMLGVVALACALVMAALLPHMPPTFLGAGLARNAEANNLSGGGEVTFTETMDPAEDLRSRSDTPVVEYTTTAARVQPLRVSAASEFDGQRWLAPSRIGARVQGPDLPAPVGLSPQAVVSSEEVAVSQNRLQAPHLAVPVGTTAVSVSPPTVQVSEDSDAVLLQAPVEEYSATYQEVSADPQPQPVGPSARTIAEQDPRLVRVPEASRAAVTERAEQVLGTRSDPLTVGRQLQGHFRSSGYTYSLELAPQEPDAGEDPISQFLATRQGYCVQFATAMVMMARSEGIPARMAVGFLPGELQDDGVRAVLASDAHTWPELYIDGLGWTRFEPTPGARSGAAPELTQSDVDEAAPEQAPEVPETEPETDSQTGPSAEEPTRREALLGWVGRWGWLLLAGAVVALGLTVLPLVGRWYRRHEARQAQSERDFVESQWLVLTRSLTDLGVPDPGARSPRAMEAHYEDRLGLAPESREALHRLSSTLEQTRYANVLQGEHVTADAVSTDVETVVESVRTSVSRLARARAVLLPRSGRTGVAEWLRARGSRGRTGQSR